MTKPPDKKMEYKGEQASIIMLGTKRQVPGWQGELFVAVIQYGSKENFKYDVVPDSTHPGDIDDLPEVKTFDSQVSAISHFMKLEQNKDKWK